MGKYRDRSIPPFFWTFTHRRLRAFSPKSRGSAGHSFFRVTTRASNIEALEAFRNNPDGFDLVITDMTMPNMTGKDLAKELMVIRPDIPIILCTGFSEKIDERRAEEMGISAYVMKTIVMRDMANTIREVLPAPSTLKK